MSRGATRFGKNVGDIQAGLFGRVSITCYYRSNVALSQCVLSRKVLSYRAKHPKCLAFGRQAYVMVSQPKLRLEPTPITGNILTANTMVVLAVRMFPIMGWSLA